jgi:hypothetical protein
MRSSRFSSLAANIGFVAFGAAQGRRRTKHEQVGDSVAAFSDLNACRDAEESTGVLAVTGDHRLTHFLNFF